MSCSGSMVGARTTSPRPFSAAKGAALCAPRRPSQQQQQQPRRRAVEARVAAEVAAAVQQQAIAYALVLGAEGAFSLNSIPAADPGRPKIPLVAAGVGGTLAATALVSLGGDSPVGFVGLVVGLLTSGAMFAACVDRVRKLEYSDGDWPGPKAWPSGMALISFFALSVFWQSLFAASG